MFDRISSIISIIYAFIHLLILLLLTFFISWSNNRIKCEIWISIRKKNTIEFVSKSMFQLYFHHYHHRYHHHHLMHMWKITFIMSCICENVKKFVIHNVKKNCVIHMICEKLNKNPMNMKILNTFIIAGRRVR